MATNKERLTEFVQKLGLGVIRSFPYPVDEVRGVWRVVVVCNGRRLTSFERTGEPTFDETCGQILDYFQANPVLRAVVNLHDELQRKLDAQHSIDKGKDKESV